MREQTCKYLIFFALGIFIGFLLHIQYTKGYSNYVHGNVVYHSSDSLKYIKDMKIDEVGYVQSSSINFNGVSPYGDVEKEAFSSYIYRIKRNKSGFEVWPPDKYLRPDGKAQK